MSGRGEATLLVAFALVACDSSIKLEVVSAVVPARPSGGGSSGGSMSGSGGTAAGGLALGGEGPGAAGAAGDDDPSAGQAGSSEYPWEAPPLYVASLASFSNPGEYVREENFKAWVSTIDPISEGQDANFEVLPGLIDDQCVSFRQPNDDGSFLRHSQSRLQFTLADDVPLFLGDATFCLEPGLAEPTWVSLRSYNYPEEYVHVLNGNELWIGPDDGTDAFAGAATFRIENPFQP